MFVCKERRCSLTKPIKTLATFAMYNYYKSIKNSRFPFMFKVLVVVFVFVFLLVSVQSLQSVAVNWPHLFHSFFSSTHSSPFLVSALSFVHSRLSLLNNIFDTSIEFWSIWILKPNERNASYDYSILNANSMQLFYLTVIHMNKNEWTFFSFSFFNFYFCNIP